MTKKQLIIFIISTFVFVVSTYFFMTTHLIPEETISNEGFYAFLFTIRFIIFIPLVIGYITAVLRIFYTTSEIKQMKKSFSTLFFGLFSLILGFIILIFAIQNSAISTESEDWPTIEGTIISSEIYSYEDHEYIDGDTLRTTYYEPKITYSYIIDEVEYSSDRISFSKARFVIESDAQEVIDEYSTGTNVTVYYNQNNPSEAVLEPGVQDSGNLICGTIGAVIFIILGALVVLSVFKRYKTTATDQEISDEKRQN